MPTDLDQFFDDFRGDIEEMVAAFDPFYMGDRFEEIGERIVTAAIEGDADDLSYIHEQLSELEEEVAEAAPVERRVAEPGSLQNQNAEMVGQELYGFKRFSAYFQDFVTNGDFLIDKKSQQALYAKLEAKGVEYPDFEDDLETVEQHVAARMYDGFMRADEGYTEDAWERIHFPPSDLGRLVRRLEDRYENDESTYEDGVTEEPDSNYEEAVFKLRGITSAARTLHVIYNREFEVPDNENSSDRREIIEDHEAIREDIFEDERQMLMD